MKKFPIYLLILLLGGCALQKLGEEKVILDTDSFCIVDVSKKGSTIPKGKHIYERNLEFIAKEKANYTILCKINGNLEKVCTFSTLDVPCNIILPCPIKHNGIQIKVSDFDGTIKSNVTLEKFKGK